MFILCILLPPVAALIAGGVISGVLNLFLTLLFWIPGVIHAFMVVNNAKAEKRNKRLVKETKKQTREMVEAMKETNKPQPVGQIVLSDAKNNEGAKGDSSKE